MMLLANITVFLRVETRHDRSFLFIAAAFSFPVFWPAFLFAYEAPVKSAGKTIQPLSDGPVRMVAENVKTTLGADCMPVHVS